VVGVGNFTQLSFQTNVRNLLDPSLYSGQGFLVSLEMTIKRITTQSPLSKGELLRFDFPKFTMSRDEGVEMTDW
jgi:hypothetical protein